MRRYSLTQCPDPTDTLWAGNGTLEYGGFCCEPGYNDFYEGRMEGVGCTAAGVRTLQTNEYFALTVRTVACVRSASFPPPHRSRSARLRRRQRQRQDLVLVLVFIFFCIKRNHRQDRSRRRLRRGHTAAAAAAAAEATAAGGYGPPDARKQHGGQHGTHDDTVAGTLLPAHHEQHKDASELSGLQPPTELPNGRMRHEMANGMEPAAFHEIG
ncbi:hypothetical protein PG996_013469 [Apiospora saccharicola]|uniref:Uncharacterized protein n=1 Tax=Apiospora saccharicola TaxID=335842 RepID=A0ABR1U873_9PEZI